MSHVDGLKAVTFNRIRREVDSDNKMQQLVKAILEYPADENFPIYLATFNRYREDLSVLDGDWSESDSARSEVLQCLHSGTSKMNERALRAVFFTRHHYGY